MTEWNSNQYLKFENQRTQPSIDLVARVKKYGPKKIADIGCGPGNSTNVLKNTFPNADLIGIDSSSNMIDKATAKYPNIKFSLCDATNLDGNYDLLFSNACLQWIPNHKQLIPTLMEKLNQHGVLAVQIPMNGEEPLYNVIKEVIDDPKWGFQNVTLETNTTLSPDEYFNILSSCSSTFEIWETKYYHNLPDHKSLIEWVKSTKIRPYLAKLDEETGSAFENEILDGVKKIYPLMDNGEVILGFRRFFFIAVK